MSEYSIDQELIYNIVGAAIDVHKYLGKGFLEEVYQEALEIELKERNIPFYSQVKLPVTYKEHELKKYYLADLVCYGEIIVELKAVSQLTDSHVAQTVNYLKVTGVEHGLLINFGADRLEKRHCVFRHN